jgi:hypothetical protein
MIGLEHKDGATEAAPVITGRKGCAAHWAFKGKNRNHSTDLTTSLTADCTVRSGQPDSGGNQVQHVFPDADHCQRIQMTIGAERLDDCHALLLRDGIDIVHHALSPAL